MNMTPIKVAALVFAVLLMISLYGYYKVGYRASITDTAHTIPTFFYHKSNGPTNNNSSKQPTNTVKKKASQPKASKKNKTTKHPTTIQPAKPKKSNTSAYRTPKQPSTDGMIYIVFKYDTPPYKRDEYVSEDFPAQGQLGTKFDYNKYSEYQPGYAAPGSWTTTSTMNKKLKFSYYDQQFYVYGHYVWGD